jgi:ribonuclease D
VTPWLAGLADRQRVGSNGNGSGRAQGAPGGGPAPGWQEHLAEQRAGLAAAAAAARDRPVPSPALAALHAWREESARAARADPAAVIDDRLLELIAERRPATREELAAVPGMGPLLAARVGDGLLAAMQPHASR